MKTEQPLETQNWKQLASIQVGGSICLPLLIVGYELAKHGHPAPILFSIILGNSLLFILALIAGLMSKKRALTTVEHAARYFGPIGRKFFAVTLSGSMLGWFAIQTQCMGGDLYHLIQSSQTNVNLQGAVCKQFLSFLLAILMILGALRGLSFFTWISHLCIPLLIATIGFAVYETDLSLLDHFGTISWSSLWNGKGISLVLASSMAATIDLPTFYRHADSCKSTFKASVANYLIAMPLIQAAGMLLYYGTQSPTLTQALAMHPSFLWEIWVVCFMLLAGWTTNNLNLYSASLSLTSLSNHLTYLSAIGFSGFIGCLLIFFPMLESFSFALDLIGIFVAAMGIVMFLAFILESYGIENHPLFVWISWASGLVVGIHSLIWPFWSSGAPVLDAGLASFFILILLQAVHNIIHLMDKKQLEAIK